MSRRRSPAALLQARPLRGPSAGSGMFECAAGSAPARPPSGRAPALPQGVTAPDAPSADSAPPAATLPRMPLPWPVFNLPASGVTRALEPGVLPFAAVVPGNVLDDTPPVLPPGLPGGRAVLWSGWMGSADARP